MTRNKWIAAYLYYSNSLDVFLKNAVLPFVRVLEEKKTYEQFFFIRYFERGKHIRLRFKTVEFTSENMIRSFLTDYFTTYFRKYPSVRIEPEWVKKLPEENKFLPNDSIQFAEYEPEVERYGGPEGILISEKQFHICSETILNAINESEEWSYSKSMCTAIQLMVSFCFSMGMDIDTTIDFFEQYENMFIDAAIKSYFTEIKIENYKEYKSKIAMVFYEKYTIHKESYRKMIEFVCEAITSNEEFEENWFNYWITENKVISENLKSALLKNELIIPEFFIEKYTKGKSDIYKLFYILFSYMHMTYNRLGLENKDESFLCFIIKESLKNIKNN